MSVLAQLLRPNGRVTGRGHAYIDKLEVVIGSKAAAEVSRLELQRLLRKASGKGTKVEKLAGGRLRARTLQPREAALREIERIGGSVTWLEVALDITTKTKREATAALVEAFSHLDDPGATRRKPRPKAALSVYPAQVYTVTVLPDARFGESGERWKEAANFTLYERKELADEGRNVKGYTDRPFRWSKESKPPPCFHLELYARGKREVARCFGVRSTDDLRELLRGERTLGNAVLDRLRFRSIDERIWAALFPHESEAKRKKRAIHAATTTAPRYIREKANRSSPFGELTELLSPTGLRLYVARQRTARKVRLDRYLSPALDELRDGFCTRPEQRLRSL
ncbi:hypothetical protein N9261_00535 [bacterium]|nr:hypothetical protein [bacterium]